MKRIAPVKLRWRYLKAAYSQMRLETAYDRIFVEVLKKLEREKQIALERYAKDVYRDKS